MRYDIIPSIIAESQQELDLRIKKVKPYVKIMQLDIMDGKFVENTSLNFNFKLPKAIYEAHLMVNDPDSWIKKHHKKVDKIIFHYESADDPASTIALIKKNKKIPGIAINPSTPLGLIKPLLNTIDHVLIMTVTPGHYGSRFLPYTMEKVKGLRKLRPNIDIEVDGSINNITIKKAKKAGANLFVSGSFLQEAKDVKASIKKLKEVIEDDR